MNEPQVLLSDNLDTREDAVKIAHALWKEAEERSWENEYREILDEAGLTGTIPTVGSATAVFKVNVAMNEETMGPLAAVLRAAMPNQKSTFILVTHTMHFDGEPNQECICKSELREYHAAVALSLKAAHPHLERQVMSIAYRDGGYEPFVFAGCSGTNCVHAE